LKGVPPEQRPSGNRFHNNSPTPTIFSFNGLITPRAHLSLAGNYDLLTPPRGLDRIDRELRRVYRQAGAASAWKLLRYDTAHFETAAMRAEIVEFLATWL
jgi:hypothetical protein